MRRCWRIKRIARPAMQAVLAKLEEYMHDEHSGPFLSPAHSPVFSDKNDDASGIPGVADVESNVDGSCKEYAAIRKVFKRLEVESKENLPVEGYIDAVVHIGLNLLEIAQVVKSNKDMSASLCFSAMKLADLVDNTKELSASRRVDEAILRIIDIQKELQCVDQKLWKWCFSGRLMTVMSS
ncbi:hypothetical protein FS837_000430 [Tulasnella sp. UAMH 9824]|nr:hypothetical protein FS837_000430 [Tulasnella sp. UAMH 9824]